MINIPTALAKTKSAGKTLAMLPEKTVNAVLTDLSRALLKNEKIILAANAKDLESMKETDPNADRLALNPARIADMANDVKTVASLPSPLGKILEDRKLKNGLHLTKMTVPLGVVGVIYEARPNVTIDVFTLCFKSGNACVLKGGTDAQESNKALVTVIQSVMKKHKIDPAVILLLPPDRESATAMMTARGMIDVLIPRGGKALIESVRTHATVPVIETGAGVVHIYVEAMADAKKAAAIIYNAKTRRPSVCNAVDTLIIHKTRLKDLAMIIAPLTKKKVEIFADGPAFTALKGRYDAALLKQAGPSDFGIEFLSMKMSVKTVKDLDEALAHIDRYGSRHSEAIVTKDKVTADRFLKDVDAAAVYVNASTAFTDGGQFGMGAEIGISTQKLHARGPMGLNELVSYKWMIRGEGQTRR